MGRPIVVPTEDKLRLVLAVISGEMSIVQAARHGKVSEQSVSRWKQQFLSGGRDGLAEGGRSGTWDPRERELLSETCGAEGRPRRNARPVAGVEAIRGGPFGPFEDLVMIRTGAGTANLKVHDACRHP